MLIAGKCHIRLRRAPASFDREGTDSRLERRKRSWIPEARFT